VEGGAAMSEWIPAHKQLPGTPRCVLATDGEMVCVAVYESGKSMDYDSILGWSNACTAEPIDSVVTHWMELPEVPE
jgi:hypothetical protein